MNKFLKWTLIILGGLVLLLFVAFKVLQSQTKKHSPEATVEFTSGDLSLNVFYNRPSVKGRVIFGELVPYGETWRTGANEATTFETNKDLSIQGQTLPAGKYTLWTVPGKSEWQVIWNREMYSWGVDFSAKASRDPASDALVVTVPAELRENSEEMFTISFEEGSPNQMALAWDDVRVRVPFE
ncbi:MAG: DUF2911 domain-containing protein [Bacteroidota bacterium]